MFLVVIDRTIVSTAVPTIFNEFNSFGDIGWHFSVYSLVYCAFQLVFGKIYPYFSVRVTFVVSMIPFEAGSALSGAAPSSAAFIIGRAIAGVGAASIFAGTIMAAVYAVPLAKRPQVQGLMGAVMSLQWGGQTYEAPRKVLQVGLILSCPSVLGIYSLEWKSVKKPGNPGAGKSGELAIKPGVDESPGLGK